MADLSYLSDKQLRKLYRDSQGDYQKTKATNYKFDHDPDDQNPYDGSWEVDKLNAYENGNRRSAPNYDYYAGNVKEGQYGTKDLGEMSGLWGGVSKKLGYNVNRTNDIDGMYMAVQDEYAKRFYGGGGANGDDGKDGDSDNRGDGTASMAEANSGEDGNRLSGAFANAVVRNQQFMKDRTEGTQTQTAYGRNPRASEIGDDTKYDQKRAFDWLAKYKLDLLGKNK